MSAFAAACWVGRLWPRMRQPCRDDDRVETGSDQRRGDDGRLVTSAADNKESIARLCTIICHVRTKTVDRFAIVGLDYSASE